MTKKNNNGYLEVFTNSEKPDLDEGERRGMSEDSEHKEDLATKRKLTAKQKRQRQKEEQRKKKLESQKKEQEKAQQRQLERQQSQKELKPQESTTKPKEMDESEEAFKRDIENLERQIESLELRSKMMATMWTTRLRAPPQNQDEARARNIITAHLLKCCDQNIFKKDPFNSPPTSDSLVIIREKMLLTRDTKCQEFTLATKRKSSAHVNQLFNDSYDGGEFLSKLPVPRDGAFFILHMRPNL